MTRDADGASLAGAILQGANRTFLVPAVLAKVLESGPDAVKLFGALKTYAYGASPMPLPLLRAALEAWPDTDFIQVYGLTEVCGVISHLHARGPPQPTTRSGWSARARWSRAPRCGSSTPTPSRTCRTGEQGELWFRTPQLMKGYHNKPEATAEAITEDGWFRTGDIGRVDADGYVFVEDRLKDMIITGGENIYSIEVERVLAEHPAVAEVAVIGVPDDEVGRGGEGRCLARGRGHARTSSSRSAASGWRPTSARRRSTSSTRCRATRPARSSRRTCASRTGRAATAPRSSGVSSSRFIDCRPVTVTLVEDSERRVEHDAGLITARFSGRVHRCRGDRQ